MNVEKLLESSHALQSKKKIIVFKDKRNPQTLSFHNSNEMCVIEVFVYQILLIKSVGNIILN